MKMKIFAITGVTALAAIISACSASVPTNTTNTTNANKPAVVTNTNTANSTNATNSTNTTSTNASNTATAPATDGQVIKIDEAGIQMVVPKGFKFSKDGEDTVVKTEDEGVEVRFTVPKDGDYDKAVSAAATELDSYLDDVKITKNGEKITIDGMEATSIHGTAKDSDKEDVEFDLTVIKAPKKPVLATIYAEKASMEKEGANVQKFLQSVKKQ
jgi:ABC-type oligopeptide transport system substrate-binding subunit